MLTNLSNPSINSMSQMPSLPSSGGAEPPLNSTYQDYPFDPTAQDIQEQPAQESTSVDRDDELLSFQPTTYNFPILDSHLQRSSVSLNARLHGMFFMADPSNTLDVFPQMATPELTCYRRNLFQVMGSITVSRSPTYILSDRGERLPIRALELTISATESVEGGTVKLISVPWKTPINSPPIPPEDKSEREPTTIPLDLMSHHDSDMEFATYPFAWKRLQFRIATANNGRRKELQQHFVARLKLVATLSTGQRVAIAEARSAAIIVRGRSPRNFERKKDHPVGERAIGRKGSLPANFGRRTSSDPPKPTPTLKRERSPDNFASFDLRDLPASQDMCSYPEWPKSSSGSNSAPAFPTPTFKTPTLPSSKSPASASPPPKTRRPSYPHPDEPNTKRSRPGPSNSPRTANSTQPSPQQPYKFASLPSTLPPTRHLPSTHSSSTPAPETVNSGDLFYGYAPAVTQTWQPAFTTMSMNTVYSTPYLPPHDAMTVTASSVAAASLPAIAVTK